MVPLCMTTYRWEYYHLVKSKKDKHWLPFKITMREISHLAWQKKIIIRLFLAANMTNTTVFTNDLNAFRHGNSSAIVNSVTQTMNLEEWIRLRDYRGILSCLPLLDKNSTKISSAKKFSKSHPRKPVPDSYFLNFTSNCTEFKNKRGYVIKTGGDEDFPIAYSILFYKEIEQLEFLLRAIYRPQNIYCLHLDKFHSKVIIIYQIAMISFLDSYSMK